MAESNDERQRAARAAGGDRVRGRRRRPGDAERRRARSRAGDRRGARGGVRADARPRRPRSPAAARPRRISSTSRRRRARSRRSRAWTSRSTSSARATTSLGGRPRYSEDDPFDEDEEPAAEDGEEELPQTIADASIDLAAGARYRATGKRKTAVARVTLKPGTGEYIINGKSLDEFFPRATLQRTIRQPLETVGYETRMDVVAAMHGGGVSAQAGALRHGVSKALLEADPEPALRAQAARLPHARRAREGTQEGRPQEGP